MSDGRIEEWCGFPLDTAQLRLIFDYIRNSADVVSTHLLEHAHNPSLGADNFFSQTHEI